MAHSIYILSLFVAVTIWVRSKAQDHELEPKSKPCEPCPIAYRCSSEEDPAWATDGISCFPFLNNCYLLNENCNRQSRCETKLEVTTKDECQCLCTTACPEDYTPVCGYRGETEKKTFSNQCEMDKYVCFSGKIYSLFAQGECK